MIKRQKKVFSIKFWGVRGTLPVSGKKTVYYGGNTNCVTLQVMDKHFLIFDAGTGLKALSSYLVKHHIKPFSATLLISHPHYDHISGIPFFVPFYQQGNQFTICGPGHEHKDIKELVSGQMDGIYFPVTIQEFSANMQFRTLSVETFYIDDICISTILLNHPGYCLGYRVEYQGKIFCYITDNELYLPDSPRYRQADVDKLVSFIKEADVLVIDSTYNTEYPSKVGWGHSSIDQVVPLADLANVRVLCLYHHDLDQIDSDIDKKLKRAKALLKARHSKVRCIAPHEGSTIAV